MEVINAILDYRFMQYALLACLLSSIGCGLIGPFVVVKRISFLTGGIAHTVLAGMGIAYYFDGSPMAGAMITAVISAILIGYIKLRWKQDENILIAAFWSIGMAVGILFISKTPGYNVDLMSYLFGNILLVSGENLLLMAVLNVVIATAIISFYKQLIATAFDDEYASLRGINVELIYILMLCMVALTVVLLIQVVGLILVIALMILPAASAAQFVRSVSRMMLVSIGLCSAITVAGLMLAYQPDLPVGSTIILIAGLVYVASIALQILRTKLQKEAVLNKQEI